MTEAAEVLSFFDAPAVDLPRERGPWCSCGHEYRNKRGEPEVYGTGCPYCGARDVLPKKPFYEVSKSSIELAESCMRRWYYKYIEHLPEPKNKYAAWGIEGHEVAEEYLRLGKFPQVNDLEPKSLQSKIARSLIGGIPHIPRPNHPGLRVEIEFHFEFEGVHYGGFKDYDAPDARPLIDGTPGPLIGDHKFTGNLQYAMTEYELRCDKQGVIYAWDVMRGGKWAFVWLNWVYMLRGEQVARPVRTVIDYTSARDGMRKLNVLGRHLTQLKTRKDLTAKDYPPNNKACYKFKEACPHMTPCDTWGDRDTVGQFSEIVNEPYRKDPIMTQPSFGVADILATMAQPPNGAPPVGVVPPAPIAPPAAAPPPPTVAKAHVMFPGQATALEIPVESLPHLPAGSKVWNATANAWVDPPAAPPAPPVEPKKRGRPAKVTTVVPPATASASAPPPPPPAATQPPPPPQPVWNPMLSKWEMPMQGTQIAPAPVAHMAPPTPPPAPPVVASAPTVYPGDSLSVAAQAIPLHLGEDDDESDSAFELARIANAMERIADALEKGSAQ